VGACVRLDHRGVLPRQEGATWQLFIGALAPLGANTASEADISNLVAAVGGRQRRSCKPGATSDRYEDYTLLYCTVLLGNVLQ